MCIQVDYYSKLYQCEYVLLCVHSGGFQTAAGKQIFSARRAMLYCCSILEMTRKQRETEQNKHQGLCA